MSYGGTRIPAAQPKGCVSETLHLRLRAPYFYPTDSFGAIWSRLETLKTGPGSCVGIERERSGPDL